MKVIFLDFDGVLNSQAHRSERAPLDRRFGWETPEHEDWNLDKAAIERLNRIVELTGANVVVSSMWRVHRSVADLRHILTRNGFSGIVRAKTPVLDKPRGVEVEMWLQTAPYVVESFVILDDDDDFYEFGADRLVLTSNALGLLDEHVVKAQCILETPWTR